MKEIGTVEVGRKVTRLNTYFLPSCGDAFEVKESGGEIEVASGAPHCVFCGRLGTVDHMGKTVCKNCITQMKNLFKGRTKRGKSKR